MSHADRRANAFCVRTNVKKIPTQPARGDITMDGRNRRFTFKLTGCLLGGLILTLVGCAQVPPESVELSATLGRDLADVHRAHRALAEQYFARLKGDINAFVDETYRPFMIQKTIHDFKLVDRIQRAAASGTQPDPLHIMELFVTRMSEQIESYRKALLSDIQRQERDVLTAIDDAYQKLQNANAIVTGHLASVKKVKDVQAELLDRANLDHLREQFIDKTVTISDDIAALLEKARKGEETVDKAAATLKDLISTATAK